MVTVSLLIYGHQIQLNPVRIGCTDYYRYKSFTRVFQRRQPIKLTLTNLDPCVRID